MNLAAQAFGIAALVLLVGPPVLQAAPPSEVEARRQADEAADALTAALMPRLMTALAQGGPEEGVKVCSEIAQSITLSVGGDRELTVKRTSLRVRNPENAPDPYERAWLEQAVSARARGEVVRTSYEVLEGLDGRRELRHLRPIVFPGDPCSGCHGTRDEISSEVRALIAERYPDDHATDFQSGDLRGAISIRVPLASPSEADAPAAPDAG